MSEAKEKEKKVIERYIDAMLAGDWVALADCFEPRCTYFDFCPIGTNMQNYHVYGKEAVEMFFNNKFFFKTVVIYDPVIESDTKANYLVAYAGQNLHVQATIDKISDNGLIEIMVIRPA